MKSLFLSAFSLIGAASSARADVPTVINVEVDYMVDAGHSHVPFQIVLDSLVQMFACQGITLNILVDDAIPHEDLIQCDDLAQPFWTCPGATSFATLESQYRDTGAGWHYCIIGHRYANSQGPTTSTGRSNGLDSFILTLGNVVGDDFRVAALFAHELGHDLGLGHASPLSSAGTAQYAPNYASVMSYEFTLGGVKDRMEVLGLVGADHLFKNLDYSHGRLPTLVETGLMEEEGLGIVPVDWDCNTLIEPGPVWTELDKQNGWCTANVGVNTLSDWNDWIAIDDNTDAVSRARAKTRDWECGGDGAAVDRLAGLDAPTLTVEPCWNGRMYWLDTAGGGFSSGRGDDPISSIAFAESVAPSGSVLFLQPGTFTNGGSTVTFDKRVVLTGIGGAVIDP